MLCFHLSDDAAATGRTASRIDRAGQVPLHPGEPEQARVAGFVPKSIYQMQSRWYHLVMQKYGLPLDGRHLYAKSDWQFFAAAVATTSVRDEMLDKVGRWINETVTGTFLHISIIVPLQPSRQNKNTSLPLRPRSLPSAFHLHLHPEAYSRPQTVPSRIST